MMMIRTTSELFTEDAVGLAVLLLNSFLLEKTVCSLLSFCFAVELVSIALILFFWSFLWIIVCGIYFAGTSVA
jgi:hypothetical protein